jgi:hypothetical protein
LFSIKGFGGRLAVAGRLSPLAIRQSICVIVCPNDRFGLRETLIPMRLKANSAGILSGSALRLPALARARGLLTLLLSSP